MPDAIARDLPNARAYFSHEKALSEDGKGAEVSVHHINRPESFMRVSPNASLPATNYNLMPTLARPIWSPRRLP